MLKTGILIIFLMLFSLKSFSQPVFNSSNCFQIGDSSSIGFAIVSAPFSGFLTETGSNHTWDFSATGSPGPWTSWVSPTTSYKFRPSSESIHTTFANTEINEYALLPFARDLYYTYSAGQDSLFLNGLYTSSNYEYVPRIPYLTFPLAFNDSVFTTTNLNNSGGQQVTGVVTRYWIYDGYGMLKLPYGNVPNVVRIRTNQVDSSTVINMVISRNEELIWFDMASGIPVLRLVKQGETTVAAYYASATLSAGWETKNRPGTSNIYPNPAQSVLQIHGTDLNVGFSILDLSGRVLKTGNTNTDLTTISIEELNSGIYFFHLNGNTAQRFVKTN
jgi:hypothetical protein